MCQLRTFRSAIGKDIVQIQETTAGEETNLRSQDMLDVVG